MDKHIKLISKYQNVKLLFEIPTRKDSDDLFMGLFNLKIIKEKKDSNSHILGFQTSNPDFMPNYMININTFFSRLTHQSEDNPIIGFYQLVESSDLNVGDFIHISLNDQRRFDEAPFQIISINDDEVVCSPIIDKYVYKEIKIDRTQFEKLKKESFFYKYEKLEEDWFDIELESWLKELKNKD